MKLSKAKRQHLRKKADEHREQLVLMEINVDELIESVEQLEDAHNELKSKITTERKLVAAITNLQTAITNLTVAVDAAVTALGAPPITGVPEADVQAAADLVTAQTTRLVAATPVPTPPPPPPPAPTP